MIELIKANGSVFKVPLHDPVVRSHFTSPHAMTNELMHQIQNTSMYAMHFKGRTGMVFLDLGANTGLVSAYASESCRRIVAVEPSPINYPVMCKVLAEFNHVEPVCAAISSVDQEVVFFENDVNSTASSTVNTYGKPTRVRGVKLSTLVRERNLSKIDFCKIDIEGGEGESITNHEIYDAKDRIDSYYIETHNCPKTTWEHKLGEIVGNLARCGYHHMIIDGMGVHASKTPLK